MQTDPDPPFCCAVAIAVAPCYGQSLSRSIESSAKPQLRFRVHARPMDISAPWNMTDPILVDYYLVGKANVQLTCLTR